MSFISSTNESDGLGHVFCVFYGHSVMHLPHMPLPSRTLAGVGLAVALLTGCATSGPSVGSPSQQVERRLAEILDAAQAPDLIRLDSYHWYGPHFTKFASTGSRLDAASAREGEHKGLSALAGLKLHTEGLQIDIFGDAALATFVMTASFRSGADTVTKRDRGTLVFVKHGGSWQIVHEHFSAAE
jgi:ketosteroid isomerase-like protein